MPENFAEDIKKLCWYQWQILKPGAGHPKREYRILTKPSTRYSIPFATSEITLASGVDTVSLQIDLSDVQFDLSVEKITVMTHDVHKKGLPVLLMARIDVPRLYPRRKLNGGFGNRVKDSTVAGFAVVCVGRSIFESNLSPSEQLANIGVAFASKMGSET